MGAIAALPSHPFSTPTQNHTTTTQWPKNVSRCEQGPNLCGKIPLDFESNALTTRPSQPCHPTHFPHQLETAQQPPSGPKSFTLRTGFEPVREDLIGFRVQHLNHSAIAALPSHPFSTPNQTKPNQ